MATLNALGHRATQVYDAAGRMTALVDWNAHRNTFQYDRAGRRTVEMDPLLRRTTFTYTAAGASESRRDARGNRTTHVYDDAGRRTGLCYSDGTRFTFAYDEAGNRTLMADLSGRTTSTYDELNRPATVTNPAGKQITYAYDAVGRRAGMIDPDAGRFTYVYDAAGRFERVTNPHGELTRFSYDAAGRTITQQNANCTCAFHTYDAAGRLVSLSNERADRTVLSSFDYTYDKAGNRTGVVEADGSRVTWTYDANYRLTREHRSGPVSLDATHTYDPAGNRLVKIEDGARTTYTYDAANQVSTSADSAGTTTFTYDADGNLELQHAPSGRTTHTWDIENRLTRVSLPSGTRNTMVYNADGLRVEKQESTGTTKSVWDGANILLQTDAAGVTQALYTLQPVAYGNLISERRGATSHFHHFDALGSTAGLTDHLAELTDRYLYKAYGGLFVSTGSTSNPFRWVGQVGYAWDDESLPYYVRARHYDPGTGRWMSKDPVGYAAGDFNLYRYGNNGPTDFVDPSGLQPNPCYVRLVSEPTTAFKNCGMGGRGWFGVPWHPTMGMRTWGFRYFYAAWHSHLRYNARSRADTRRPWVTLVANAGGNVSIGCRHIGPLLCRAFFKDVVLHESWKVRGLTGPTYAQGMNLRPIPDAMVAAWFDTNLLVPPAGLWAGAGFGIMVPPGVPHPLLPYFAVRVNARLRGWIVFSGAVVVANSTHRAAIMNPPAVGGVAAGPPPAAGTHLWHWRCTCRPLPPPAVGRRACTIA